MEQVTPDQAGKSPSPHGSSPTHAYTTLHPRDALISLRAFTTLNKKSLLIHSKQINPILLFPYFSQIQINYMSSTKIHQKMGKDSWIWSKLLEPRQNKKHIHDLPWGLSQEECRLSSSSLWIYVFNFISMANLVILE